MTDWCSQQGANELAERIRLYWAKRGHIIKTGIHDCAGYGGQAGAWCVRSDLIRGIPQGSAINSCKFPKNGAGLIPQSESRPEPAR